MDMFVFPQLKQFKTSASTSCNSVEVIPRTSALAQTKNLKKKNLQISSKRKHPNGKRGCFQRTRDVDVPALAGRLG